MKNAVIAALIGTIIGAGIFLLWRSAQLPPAEKFEERPMATSEAELKVGDYFDLRGKKEALVTIDHGEFNPKIIIVDQGVKIFWKNTDSAEHALSVAGHWQVLKRNEVFTLVLDAPGTYQYQGDSDTIRGLIIVK